MSPKDQMHWEMREQLLELLVRAQLQINQHPPDSEGNVVFGKEAYLSVLETTIAYLEDEMMGTGKYQMFANFCQLCREYELAHYGTLLEAGAKHFAAVKAAGCMHRANYVLDTDKLKRKGK